MRLLLLIAVALCLALPCRAASPSKAEPASSAPKVAAWLRALKSKELATRLAAAYDYAEFAGAPTAEDVAALQRAAEDADPVVRQRVAAALGDLPADAPLEVAVLLKLLRDKQQAVRDQATVALSKRGTPAVKPLLALLTETGTRLPLTEEARQNTALGAFAGVLCLADYAAVALHLMESDLSGPVAEHAAGLIESTARSLDVADLSSSPSLSWDYDSAAPAPTPQTFALRSCVMLLADSKAAVFPVLEKWLASENERMRALALAVLQQRWNAPSEDEHRTVPMLVKLLDDPAAPIRQGAAMRLGKTQLDEKTADKVWSRFTHALEAEDVVIRRGVAELILKNIADAPGLVGPALAKRLPTESDPDIREALSAAIAKSSVKEGGTGAAPAARDTPPNTEPPAAAPTLREFAALSAQDREKLLSESDDPLPEALVLAALGDRAPAVRRAAGIAIRKQPSERLVTAFVRLLDDPNAGVREESLGLLNAQSGGVRLVGPATLAWLGAQLASKKTPPDTKRSLTNLLSYVGPPAAPAVPALIPLLRNDGLREFALQALGAIGPAAGAAIPAISRNLSDASARVRSEAAGALSRIIVPPEPLPPPALTILCDEHVARTLSESLTYVINNARRFDLRVPPPVAGAALPEFSWTRPSKVITFGPELSRDLVGAPGDTLEAVHKKLVNALLRADENFTSSLFAAPGGFVVLSEMERVNREGVPLPAPDRWTRFKVLPKTWGEVVTALFIQKPAVFRCFAFVVTDETNPNFLDQPLSEASHAHVLPEEIARMPLGNKNCFLYLYCFEKYIGGKMNVSEIPLSPRAHLEKAGILAALSPIR